MDLENENKILNLLEKLKICTTINEDEITSACVKLTDACHVPRLNKAEDVPYVDSDFVGTAVSAESHLTAICRILEALCIAKSNGQHFTALFIKNIVVSCSLLASEFTDGELEWSDEKTAFAADSVLGKVCELLNHRNSRELFNGCQGGTSESCENSGVRSDWNYLESILQKLTNTLNKNTWKAYPAAKASYWFILTLLDQKSLGNHISYLLPPALLLVDDWEQKNKVLGLKSLHYILENTTASEIRWYGRAAVIFDALKFLLHSREVEILELLYPTITLAAKILESDPANTGYLRKMSSCDTIMQQMVQEMRYEQNLALRTVYSSALPGLLSAMGILAIKWSEELIPMCDEYLSTFSSPSAEDRLNVLKALQIYIQECWPQIHVNAFSILKMILRLVYDITDKDSGLDYQVVETLKKEVLNVVKLLHAAAPKTTQTLFYGILSTEVHPECGVLLKEIEKIVASVPE